jgi:hypothetical protein
MIEPPNEDDRRHAASDYLHFENEDVSPCDIYFASFDDAIDFVNERGWSFATEDWEPAGLFETRIECKDRQGSVVAQLLMLTIKIVE